MKIPCNQHIRNVLCGKTRSGNQRFRCNLCGRRFVENPGNNQLKPAKAEALRVAFISGLSARAAARKAGVAKETASKYREAWGIEAACACGQPAGHRGWCRERLKGSPSRQRLLVRLHGGIDAGDRKIWAVLRRAIVKSGRAFSADEATMNAAFIMWAALPAHFDLCRIAELTGIELAEIGVVSGRYRRFGIWDKTNCVTCALSEDEAGDLCVWLDAMVGTGELQCTGETTGARLYSLVQAQIEQA